MDVRPEGFMRIKTGGGIQRISSVCEESSVTRGYVILTDVNVKILGDACEGRPRFHLLLIHIFQRLDLHLREIY